MSVHELVSCACGASVDVVFIPPELLGGQPVVAARRVAPMPGSAMSRIAAWDAPRQPLMMTRVQTRTETTSGPAVTSRSWGSVKKLASRLRRGSSAARLAGIDSPPALTAEQGKQRISDA